MDELMDKKVSDTTVLESSKEVVSDQVASEDSEKIRVVKPVDREVQAQGEDVAKEVVGEEGGSCNGADIIVGVMGSDIYVDGVCIRDFGDGGGGNLSEEVTSSRGGSKVVGAERDMNRDDGVINDSGSKATLDSGAEASNLETRSEVPMTSGAAESKEEEKLQQGNDDDSGSKITTDLGTEASDLGAQNEVRTLSGVVESKEEEKLGEGRDGVAGDSGPKATVDSNVETSSMETEREVRKSSGVEESKEEEKLEDGHGVAGDSGSKTPMELNVEESGLETESKVGKCPRVEEGKLVEVGDGVAGDYSSKAAMETVVEASDLETQNEVGKSSGVEESKEELKLEDGNLLAGDYCSKATMEKDAEPPGLETENEVRNSSGVAESKEEETLVGGGTSSRDISDADENDPVVDKTSQKVGVRNDQNMEIGSAVEGSCLVESSYGGEIQFVAEKAAVAMGEESVDGRSGKECVDRGGTDAINDVNSQEAGVSELEAQDQIVENSGGSSAKVGSSEDEAKVVAAVQKSELVEKAMDQANETNGSKGEQLQDSEIQNIGVLHDEVWNPGIETTVALSSTIKEDSNIEAKIVEEGAVVMANDENLSPKVGTTLEGAHAVDAMEGIVPSSEIDSVSTEKYPVANATFKSFDDQTQVAVDGTVASIDSEEITCPNVDGMDTDAFNENFCFSVEELQATFEAGKGSTENHYDACADMPCSQQPTQVIGGEVAATDNKVLLHSEEGKKLLVEECSDQSMPHDSAQIHSNAEPDIWEEQGKVQTTIVSTENHSTVGLNQATYCQSAQAVVDNEVKKMDFEVHSDPNFEGAIDVPLDGMLASSENVQHVKPETEPMETDIQIAIVSEPAERDQELNLKEGLSKSASDAAQVDSNRQGLDAQQQVSHVEELGEEDKEAEKQNTGAEAVSLSTETDTLIIYGRQTAIANNDVTLNPNTGLNGPGEADQHIKLDESLNGSADLNVSEFESNLGNQAAVEEHVSDFEQVGLQEGQEEADEQDNDSEQPKITEEISGKEATLNPISTIKAHQASYELPPDDEGEFAVSDLVWGKVRSHPWWPGQIFDPLDASEKAMKYQKKDCFLVAYFGDRTFAWNEASLLKPFRSHFSQVEKQSNSETFQNAVNCALEEVSRRVEFGLACSCIPKDLYDKIKFQMLEKTGIRQKSSIRDGVDKSLLADSFEPSKLVEYMKALAQSPAGGADRLELVIAKSQLLAFYRLKGYELPEFHFCGELLENADSLHFADTSPVYEGDGQISLGQEIVQTQRGSYHKRKHNLKDSIYPRNKERSMSDLIGESWDLVDDEIDPDNNKLVSLSSGKKRKGSDPFADESVTPEVRKTISLAKVSTTASPLPKPSFKIGECIRRVASLMTGSPSILKANSQKQDGNFDGLVGDGSDVSFQHSEDAEMKRMTVPTEYSSLDDLVSQLHLAARDPLKGYSFLTIIIDFFSDFRNSVIMEQHDKVGGKRRHSIGGFETFEFEDMSDTYWTDRVIQNGSEEQPSRKSRKRDNAYVPLDLSRPVNKSNSRKPYSDGNYGQSLEKPAGYVDEKAPAELVMHFPVVDSVPSEISLNKMFRRFGPLKESGTEVDKDTNRARVVFKKCSDAEAAYGSAPKFNIFGSVIVNYQLNYTISVPFKTQPVATLQDEDATLFLQY